MKATLTTPEWNVMTALWRREPQTLSEVIASMGDTVEWKYTTYATYLNKLAEKGYVGFDARGRDKFYYAVIEQDECLEAESRSLIEKVSEESAKKLLVSMIRDINLSKADQQELKALIDRMSEGDE